MRGIHRNSLFVPSLAIALLSLLAGCASKHVSTSVTDQTFEPGQPTVAQAAPPAPVGETRVTAAPVPSQPSHSPAIEQPAQASAGASVVELTDAYFDFDQATVRSDARSALEGDGRTLKSELKDKTIVIEGHCDEIGTAAYNLVLGEKRARAVQRYLHDLGVTASRLQVASYGKERPFCTEHNPDCWQSNRRAHFVVK